jgi:hypothetical protein
MGRRQKVSEKRQQKQKRKKKKEKRKERNEIIRRGRKISPV